MSGQVIIDREVWEEKDIKALQRELAIANKAEENALIDLTYCKRILNQNQYLVQRVQNLKDALVELLDEDFQRVE